MKKSLLNILKYAAFLALGVLLLVFAFRGIALEELKSTLREANFWWIGLSLCLLTLGFFARARRWMLLIQPLGYQPSFWNTYHGLMFGYLSNFALPRLGEVTRCVSLGRREKIPVDALIGTVIIERVTDMVMLFLILGILLISWMDKFGTFFSQSVFGPMQSKVAETFGGMLIFWILVFGLAALLVSLLYTFRKRLMQIRLVAKVVEFLKGILDGLKTIYRMERKWEFIFQSILIWTIYIFMTWVIVFAIPATSHLGFVDGVFLLVVGGLGMAAPVTAGFGAYHWITSRGLMYVYGLSLEQGTAYAILAHEPNSMFTILLGALSYALLMMARKKS